jgi:ribosomal protein L40E
VGEILGALLGTFVLTRLCAWSFRPSAERAIVGSVAAAAVVVLLSIVARSLAVPGSPEATLAHASILFGPCYVGLWLVVDLLLVARDRRIKLEARERVLESQEEQVRRETRRWGSVLKEAELKDGPPLAPAVRSGSCTHCGAAVPPDARFCDACGGKLTNECPKCHASNREEARFCKQCGGALSAA